MASSSRVDRVLALAAELSREEQEEVAAELLVALEPEVDSTAESWNVAWREELERRAATDSPGVPWEEARSMLDARLAEIRAERGRR